MQSQISLPFESLEDSKYNWNWNFISILDDVYYSNPQSSYFRIWTLQNFKVYFKYRKTILNNVCYSYWF